jgi:ubiquinone/menaquinone biosynthesis C-methylase UbiE
MNQNLKYAISEYWSKYAPGYDQPSFFYAINFRRDNEPYVLPLLQEIKNNGGKTLEVGCGLGVDTYWFYNNGCDITSIDIAQANVDYVNTILPNANVFWGDAEKLPFYKEHFDTYYSFGVLHHTPDIRKAISEAYRVLKPGGKIIIMLYHKGYAYWWLKLLRKSTNDYDHTPLSQMFSKSQIYDLMGCFKDISIEITTFAFGGSSVAWWLKPLHVLLKNKFLMSKLGQFAIIKARKG